MSFNWVAQLVCCTVLSVSAGPVVGQTFPIFGTGAKIAIVDQEALFTQSALGKAIINGYAVRGKELALENAMIQKSLEQEELQLTKDRKTMVVAEFTILAQEFDEKVKRIRVEQANKERAINQELSQDRKIFFEKMTPILLGFIDDNGIEVVLNKETVVLATTGQDITQAAIQRIDELLKK